MKDKIKCNNDVAKYTHNITECPFSNIQYSRTYQCYAYKYHNNTPSYSECLAKYSNNMLPHNPFVNSSDAIGDIFVSYNDLLDA